jgi:hypothetical protein
VTVAKSVLWFVVATLLEIGGAWLVWRGVREDSAWVSRRSCTFPAACDPGTNDRWPTMYSGETIV